MPDLYSNHYNPDVLSCLANLSNDEVFTPPQIANAMLDLLPQELFRDPNTKFLDPAAKTGVFLREIARRLIVGLADQIPDLQARLDHIFHEQIYGIAMTEITSLLSRRSLYCSKYPNGRYSVTPFDSVQGNVRFKNTRHRWKNGRCVFCGASESQYQRSEGLETHAYEFIHTIHPEEIWNMKFDVIIGNPPYQLSDGGNGASATPIYQLFVEQAKKLNPRYLSMVIPARWFVGGRGLDEFRNTMLNDTRIRELHDYSNASDCFPGVEIKGGICYFLWSRDDQGLCKVYSHSGNTVTVSERPLLETGMDTFIRNDIQIQILHKIRSRQEASFSSMLNAGRFFGFHTRINRQSKLLGDIQTADGKSSIPIRFQQDKDYSIKIYIHGGECWIKETNIPKNKQFVKEYKVIIPRSGNPGSTILGNPKISEPGSCSSNSYVVAVLPEGSSKEYASNVVDYLKTKFLRSLVAMKTTTQDMAPKTYQFVPIQDFSISWTDEMLYAKYSLTDEEIAFIESTIKPME